MVVHVPNGTNTSRHTVKVAFQIAESQLVLVDELIAMHAAVVVAHAAIQCPAIQTFAGSGIDAEVEQPVFGNQRLLAFVQRLLIHAADACRQFPTVPFLCQVAHVIGQRVQLKESLVFVHALLVFLAAVLLIAHNGFQVSRRQVHAVVPHQLIVFYLLEG